ncbi:ENOSF1 (predicted) [Pycnogonum litorale]
MRSTADCIKMADINSKIRGLSIRDIRFPTSLTGAGSDSVHSDPDYSCVYVIIYTADDLKGHGITFTIGRGNEVVVQAVKALASIVVGQKLSEIFDDFGGFWKKLTNDSQLRWIGPEKGVIHLATAAIVNALWDLWAKLERKPLWKLLVDMEPEKLVSTMDFRYLSDVLTKEEALEILKKMRPTIAEREETIRQKGYPAYCTHAGWSNYPEQKIRELCREALELGFTRFKCKVGTNIDDDKTRCKIIRDEIGYDNTLMVDANQKWDVDEAIDWMKKLAMFKPLWIEEPTSPDDILGHKKISDALKPYKIGVATGEMCQNRVMFKQFLRHGAMQYCQIDSCRLGGVNEVLTVYLMAAKFNIPVCPHAGGVGLCELVQHLSIFDYICISGSTDDRVIEYVDHLHEHFVNPVRIVNAAYIPPLAPGYSTEMKETSLQDYEYPIGPRWKKLFGEKKIAESSVPHYIMNTCFTENH